jgi:SAM-dependent methyltransferase
MGGAGMNTYDRVLYPDYAIPQSHPTKLAVIGAMLGMSPKPPETARVLDIGCGAGANLLPLALLYPQAEFTGIDLAGTVIEKAKTSACELGLSNIRFEHLDLMELPESLGPFDYILAHGFLSWVPEPVRRRLFSVCRERLTPQGIAYISYNAYPGCHIREMFREIMLYHTRHIEDPEQRATEARAIVRMIEASCGDADDPVHQIAAAEYELIGRKSTGGMTHDDLNEYFQPFYFREFAALAAAQGLQFLHEASYNDGQPPPLMTDDGTALLEQAIQRGGFLEREQYLDFLKIRRFRQSLIVPSDVVIDRTAPHRVMDRFHYAALLDRQPAGEAVEFTNRATKAAVGTSDPLMIRALDTIGSAWPATADFARLHDGGGDIEHLKQSLERYFAAGVVEAHASPRACAHYAGNRPEIWSYSRWQAANGPYTTALTMNGIRLEDPNIRKLVLAADGSRTLDELGTLFGDRASVEKALLTAAQFGFLVQ